VGRDRPPRRRGHRNWRRPHGDDDDGAAHHHDHDGAAGHDDDDGAADYDDHDGAAGHDDDDGAAHDDHDGAADDDHDGAAHDDDEAADDDHDEAAHDDDDDGAHDDHDGAPAIHDDDNRPPGRGRPDTDHDRTRFPWTADAAAGLGAVTRSWWGPAGAGWPTPGSARRADRHQGAHVGRPVVDLDDRQVRREPLARDRHHRDR
jgi:hypothetical protein